MILATGRLRGRRPGGGAARLVGVDLGHPFFYVLSAVAGCLRTAKAEGLPIWQTLWLHQAPTAMAWLEGNLMVSPRAASGVLRAAVNLDSAAILRRSCSPLFSYYLLKSLDVPARDFWLRRGLVRGGSVSMYLISADSAAAGHARDARAVGLGSHALLRARLPSGPAWPNARPYAVAPSVVISNLFT